MDFFLKCPSSFYNRPKDLVEDFGTINAFLQSLIHYFADAYEELQDYIEEGAEAEFINKLIDLVVKDVGVICFSDIHMLLKKARKDMITYYNNPRLFQKNLLEYPSDLSEEVYLNSVFFQHAHEIVQNIIIDINNTEEAQNE